MPRNIQLLKQIRNLTRGMTQTAASPEHKELLSIIDLFLNQLVLQDSSQFYLDHIRQGKILLSEGRGLAGKFVKLRPQPAVLRDDLSAETRIEAIHKEIGALNQCLVDIVGALNEGRSAQEKDYLVRLSQWEISLYTHREEDAPAAAGNAKTITREAVQDYLEKKFPQWTGLRVTDFVPLDGGLSKKTILVDTEDAVNAKQSLVIRAEQPIVLMPMAGSDVTQEYYMVQLMQKLGIPSAETLWLEEDRTRLGERLIVFRKTEGKLVGGNFGNTEPVSDQLFESIMSVFFRIHNIKIDPADPLVQKSHLREWLPHKTIRDTALHYATEFLPNMARQVGVKMTPLLLRSLRWLEHNAPDSDEPPALLHGDYAYNNLLVHGDKVSAVLDWETSRLGDPADEIIWTQQNLGRHTMPEFLRLYKEATGRDVTEYRLVYARLAKCVMTLIVGTHTLQSIDTDDNAPPKFGVMAFTFVPYFVGEIDKLIALAESIRGR